jgi:hypothetical protein
VEFPTKNEDETNSTTIPASNFAGNPFPQIKLHVNPQELPHDILL